MSKKATGTKRERDPAACWQRLMDATVGLMLRQGGAATSAGRMSQAMIRHSLKLARARVDGLFQAG